MLHPPGGGDDRGERRPVEQEVVLERRRHRLLDPLDAVPERLQELGGPAGESGDLGARADVDAVGHHGDGTAGATGAADVADRREAQVAVDALGLAEERRAVAHRPGEHAVGDDADRHLTQWAVLGQPAAGRLQPDQAVDGGRDPDRAAAVVAVGERDGARGDERRRTGRRGAGGVLGRPRRPDGAQPGVLGGGAEAVLRQLGLADRHQSGGEEHPREVAVALGRPRRERVGALHGREPRQVDVVLEEGRYAGEPAAARLRGLGPGPVEAVGRERVERGRHLLGAGDGRLDHLGDRHVPGREGRDQPHRVQVAEGVVGEGVHASHERRLAGAPTWPDTSDGRRCGAGGRRVVRLTAPHRD